MAAERGAEHMAESADQGAETSHPVEPMMSLADASAATGRPAEAIRAMIRRGRLKAMKGNDGRTLVAIPAALFQPPGQPQRGRANGHASHLASRNDGADGRVAGLQEAVEEWRAAAEESRLAAAVAEAKLEEAGRVHAAEVAAAVAKVEAAERVIVELRTMLDASRAEAVKGRRGWLERVLEAVRRRDGYKTI
jgi:hypothetical protein